MVQVGSRGGKSGGAFRAGDGLQQDIPGGIDLGRALLEGAQLAAERVQDARTGPYRGLSVGAGKNLADDAGRQAGREHVLARTTVERITPPGEVRDLVLGGNLGKLLGIL